MSDDAKMSPWVPDNNPRQARRVGKFLEETGELVAVLARISIQGIDSVDPSSGKTNRQRLHEEMADVQAQIECAMRDLELDPIFLAERTRKKVAWMAQWEAHFDDQ